MSRGTGRLSRRPRAPLSRERLLRALAPEAVDREKIDTLRDRVVVAWWRTMRRLFPLGGTSDGNIVTLFDDGDAAFIAMLHAIENARERVWLETYILEPDALGQRVLDSLLAARERGCEVRLLFDAIGSPGVTRVHTGPLEQAGVRVAVFNPPLLSLRNHRIKSALTRDHRKILIVDDEAYVGGMNVSVDYAGDTLGNGRFRDTHARLEGPGVRELAGVLARSWKVATGDELGDVPTPSAFDDGVFTQVLRSDVRRRRRQIQRALRQTIGRSLMRCWLTTPYFVPPALLMRAIRVAARRGVDVRVLTAGLSDVPLVRRASRHLYGRLLKAGVRIYELRARTLHAKTATIDGLYASVGSFNLDYWSWRRNLEVSLTVIDAGTADQLARHFERDLEGADEIALDAWSQRGLIERVVDFFAYQLMKL